MSKKDEGIFRQTWVSARVILDQILIPEGKTIPCITLRLIRNHTYQRLEIYAL